MLLDPALTSEDAPEVDPWFDRVQSAGAFEEESWFALSAADSGRFRRSGALKMNTDDAVPLARNREMLAYYRASLERELLPLRDLRPHRRRSRSRQHILRPRRSGPRQRSPPRFRPSGSRTRRDGAAEHGLGKCKRHLLDLQYSRGGDRLWPS